MSWYFEVNAGDIPDSPFPEEGISAVIKLCGIGSFIGALVICGLLIHSLHYMAQIKDNPLSRKFLYFELLILCLFLMSCLGMSLGRCDAIIAGDFSEIGCWLGYYFEVIAYSLGKLLTYLFFTYRVYYAFQGTAFDIGPTMKYVVILGILCYSVVVFLQILLLPLHVDMWIWLHADNVKLCIIPQAKLPPIITSSFGTLPFIDLVFCGYLCYFFVKRLRGIRLFILQLSVTEPDATRTRTRDDDRAASIQTSTVSDPDPEQQSQAVQPVEQPVSIEVVVHDITEAYASEEDKQFMKDIEFLVWKQTILIIVALVTTMCTVWWIWILPVLTNLIVFDAIMNAICVHLIFRFCDPFWNMLKRKCCCEQCDNKK